MSSLAESVRAAAEAIGAAEALVITAGAGMGVDSGLPDFRGSEGFWKAYPGLGERGLDFYAMATPERFREDPALAWQFYGHRQALYVRTSPHAGFGLLRRWAAGKPGGAFVFTSNVDGQFQKAGFDPSAIFECHGNIHRLQCLRPCSGRLWETSEPVGDAGDVPVCPGCGDVARPNVLMFGDFGWISDASDAQHSRYRAWLKTRRDMHVTVIELGAGLAVPTVRLESEALVRSHVAQLVRINPREAEGPAGSISLGTTALAALRAIAQFGDSSLNCLP